MTDSRDEDDGSSAARDAPPLQESRASYWLRFVEELGAAGPGVEAREDLTERPVHPLYWELKKMLDDAGVVLVQSVRPPAIDLDDNFDDDPE